MESNVCNLSNMWTKKMPAGLGLEISHQPPSMRHVVNLIIAMERLKAGVAEKVLSTDFRDENLISIMLESVVEEKHFFESQSGAPYQFHMFEEHECSVTDSRQRSFVLVKDSMELHAMTLQAANLHHKVFLNMAMYTHNPSASSPGALLVALGIKGTNLYLCCQQNGDTPTLHLEAVDKETLLNIDSESEKKRFLFYKQDKAVNQSTFTSASFPKWYISTSTEDKRPVEMCQETTDRYIKFKIQSLN
ncbi:interleukin-1 beta [Austrofundulus limnaeus]|uniref:Interleukin-1 n=1 Tax=Austrofundulus limnaeus TaxID=52670 RepID=A0A2I4AHI5_AUSLI|nr:PREDICTED: interleukin-1 beta [Austrofundulus limnaeus]